MNGTQKTASFIFLVIIIFVFGGCTITNSRSDTADELYNLFKDPPAEARPFVRWWWNGDCIEVDELRRELDVMKAAGIGGFEINPIAKPGGGDPFDYHCYDWLSPEWNNRVKAAAEMAKQREMVVDLLMGSGWPFGGEFLKKDQFLQGVGIRKMELKGPQTITLNVKKIWKLPGKDFGPYNNKNAPAATLFFLQMIPHGASGITDLIDLKDDVAEDGTIEIKVPAGKYDLYIGTFQRAYRTVLNGAAGSKGPVVDHFDAQDVRAYMDRLADALEAVLGGKLGDYFRALFCDSIELSGANITDDFFDEFLKRRGYDLKPFVSLVYYDPYKGYTDTLHYDQEFNDDIRRIRYDFNRTLVELFQERFIKTFNDWAHEHGMQSRFQAYGMPWLMGMLDGYRMVDIPEGNNWLFSPNARTQGFWIWNKYASSAAHLSGAKEVSCEAMTNTRGVFKATLSMIKKNDDFNFITGINHSVLHGFNYSPPEAGFPGWLRYGTYFSEQNTWWPYFRYWADYNARLSSLFQHSDPVTEVAILTPEADIWKQWGLYREPFYLNPWYNFDLWESFSRLGVSADYINEGVIQRAVAVKNNMKSENATYKLVIVSGVTSMLPETATAINNLAQKGVKFVFIDHFPSETPSFFNKNEGDRQVDSLMKKIASYKNILLRKAPAHEKSLTEWTARVLEDVAFPRTVTISPVDKKLYVLKHSAGPSEIYFFSNQDDHKEQIFTATFAHKNKTAWYWDPQTGERFIYPQSSGKVNIRLQPLESILIVLEKNDKGKKKELIFPDENSSHKIGKKWILRFHPFKGKPFEITTEKLFDFGTSKDKRITSFAGEVTYQTSFELDDIDWSFVDLGIENNITEVKINGVDLGVKWWGRHLYAIDKGVLRKGTNTLQIKYTTTLANYVNSLKNNPVAKRWVNIWLNKTPGPSGLNADVKLMKQELYN